MINDIMWQNFVPLWKEIATVDRGMLLAGGYAPFHSVWRKVLIY